MRAVAKFVSFGLIIVVLAILGAAFGGWLWTRGVAPAAVSATELKRGGDYSPLEREALSAACMSSPNGTPVRCTCLTGRAGHDLSPFERRVTTASLAGDAQTLVALTKGLIAARATPEQIKEAQLADDSRRIRLLLTSCGFPA